MSSGSSMLKDPMSVAFGDSDLSMSDIDGDVEIAADDSGEVSRRPRSLSSSMDAAKKLLGAPTGSLTGARGSPSPRQSRRKAHDRPRPCRFV